MFRFNHKYYSFLVLFLAIAFADEGLYISKVDDGLYEVIYEKQFEDIGDRLSLIIEGSQGNININGRSASRLGIVEHCRIKSYSEKDARQKYYQSKMVFMLNDNALEISNNKQSNDCYSTLTLNIPDYTTMQIEADDCKINIHRTDGDIVLGCRNGELVFDDVSSRIDVKSKDTEISVINCTLVGDLEASRGGLTISSLKSEYFNATLYGANLDADKIDAKVTFKTTGGNIIIDESVNDAKLFSAGGDISIDRIYGNLACDTKGGTIDIGAVDGICVLNCLSGDIYLQEVRGDLRIDAINTDVEIDAAHQSVYIESSNKDIHVTKLSSEDDSSTILIKNKEGDIDLYLDEDITADIVAKIEFNNGAPDDWEIESDFVLDQMKTEKKGKQGYISKKGKINNGGSVIILKNKNGDIYIYEN
ncbi:MAG: hypothetical protein JXQ65_10390 [Candidatus Marinimicrobia bacterium]|nr:hypothetical protein [Candidatus Neomarinimicrobiota bacterium]